MPNKINLSGLRFGKLMVICEAQKTSKTVKWLCVCDCGGRTESTTSNLRTGNSMSCGCTNINRLKSKTKDLSGIRFGRLTANRQNGHRGKSILWECCCDCGAIKNVSVKALTSGGTLSCGCLQRENRVSHGMTKTSVYRVWNAMVRRCTSPADPSFHRYGGRGITVCDQWRMPGGFSTFFADMGECPSGHSLERIDNNAGYSPNNCKWETPANQAKNRVTTRLLTLNGETKPLKDWARSLGISDTSLRLRLDKRGWSLERALTTGDSRFRRDHLPTPLIKAANSLLN